MGHHFLQLYLSIVVTLAAVSWGQDQLWRIYGESAQARSDSPPEAAVLAVVDQQLRGVPDERKAGVVAEIARSTGFDLELLEPQDIAGAADVAALANGKPALMSAADGDLWVLQRVDDGQRVLAFRYEDGGPRRGPLEWVLSFVFYAAIALVIMLWLWPMTRDLRTLERSTLTFGDRSWTFDAEIAPRSPIFPLAQAFRRMAARIDGLISSHKDMSNALSHEIKTPLARMRFEVELARTAADHSTLLRHLDHLNTDIAELNAFVTATLEYAVLERAEVALNVAAHDFTAVLPAVTQSVQRGARSDLSIGFDIDPAATRVVCDAHLIETVLRNLLYNAIRHADREIRVSFGIAGPTYRLAVEDDGPGIAEADRERVFGSFVQLGRQNGEKIGFGLGLAIVKRIVEWHGGRAMVERSSLGGARFLAEWPVQPAHKR
jgi:two-component system, OmpR family, sensor kinase